MPKTDLPIMSDELQELTQKLRDTYGVIRDLEARYESQVSRSMELAAKLSQGVTDAESVVSEKAKEKVLGDAFYNARSQAADLCRNIETQIKKDIVTVILGHLGQAASESSGLLNNYLDLRAELNICGQSRDEIANTMLTELVLTHSSSHLIANFKTAFHLPEDLGWKRRPGVTSL